MENWDFSETHVFIGFISFIPNTTFIFQYIKTLVTAIAVVEWQMWRMQKKMCFESC